MTSRILLSVFLVGMLRATTLFSLTPVAVDTGLYYPAPTFTATGISDMAGIRLTWKEKIALRLLRHKINKQNRKSARLNQKLRVADCIKIYLVNGEVIEAQIQEFSYEVVKFKKCGEENVSETELPTKDIYIILDSRGEAVFTNNNLSKEILASNKKIVKIDPLARTSLNFGILGLVGLLLPPLGFIFSILAIILGARSLARIRKQPHRYMGRKKAMFGLMLGVLGLLIPVVIVVIIISTF